MKKILGVIFVLSVICLLSNAFSGEKIYGFVKSDLNIKAGPSEGASNKAAVVKGEKLKIFELCENWVEVETSKNVKGWILKENIEFQENLVDKCSEVYELSGDKADESDIRAAKEFLKSLPSACYNSDYIKSFDGTVIIRIRCWGENDSMSGEVSIKNGITTKIR